MSLKVELKPGERLIIGDCLITNTKHRAILIIDGKTPILRGKDVLTPKTADTPAKRIYLAVQLMYLSKNPCEQHETYFELVRELVQNAPSTWPYIENINNDILTGKVYEALKHAKKLIAYEEELLQYAKTHGCVPVGSEGDRQPA